MTTLRVILPLLMAGVVGCAHHLPDAGKMVSLPKVVTPIEPTAEVLAWSGRLLPQTEYWADEAQKRWGIRPIVFFAHGGEEWIDGQPVWYCYPDRPRPKVPVAAVAWMLRDLYPGRYLMFIVCNPHGDTLKVPGCIYAKRSVWNVPTVDDLGVDCVTGDEAYCAGKISEFILSDSSK